MKSKPNILYVFGGEKAQGAEIVIERLMGYNAAKVNTHLILSPGDYANQLIAANKPYKITVLNHLKKLNRGQTKSKASFYFKGMRNYFNVSYEIYRYIKEHQIDIVHANTVVPASYLMPLISYSKVVLPHVRWCWSDHDIRYFSGLDGWLSKQCVKMYDHTLAVSEAVKKKYSIGQNKVIILYNGLNISEFKADASLRDRFRETLNIANDVIVIGMAGSINPDKGQLSLMKVVNKLALSMPKICLLLAGGYASQFPAYREAVEAGLKENKHVTHIGFINNTAEFYNGCDIIVNNSNNKRSESLGTSIYEAMACEKIVVAANTGGTPEIITDQLDGILFCADNENDLSDKLFYVIRNFYGLDHIPLAARKKVKQKFNIETMADKYNKIINSMITDNN